MRWRRVMMRRKTHSCHDKRVEILVEAELAEVQRTEKPNGRARGLDIEQTVDEQAYAAAMAFRWQHINRPHRERRGKTKWIVVGSEARCRERELSAQADEGEDSTDGAELGALIGAASTVHQRFRESDTASVGFALVHPQRADFAREPASDGPATCRFPSLHRRIGGGASRTSRDRPSGPMREFSDHKAASYRREKYSMLTRWPGLRSAGRHSTANASTTATSPSPTRCGVLTFVESWEGVRAAPEPGATKERRQTDKPCGRNLEAEENAVGSDPAPTGRASLRTCSKPTVNSIMARVSAAMILPDRTDITMGTAQPMGQEPIFFWTLTEYASVTEGNHQKADQHEPAARENAALKLWLRTNRPAQTAPSATAALTTRVTDDLAASGAVIALVEKTPKAPLGCLANSACPRSRSGTGSQGARRRGTEKLRTRGGAAPFLPRAVWHRAADPAPAHPAASESNSPL